MISLDKRMNKALWHINASKELFSRLSILFSKINDDIPGEFCNSLKTTYKRGKNLFLEGKRSFISIYSNNYGSFSSVSFINKKYFERCLIYISDTYSLFMNVSSFIIKGSIVHEINNNLKILILQIKSVVELLR